MAQPTPYNPTTDFSQEEANNVAGRSTVRTSAVDAELSAIALTIGQILVNLAILQRDDTKVANEIIHPDSLDPNTRALMTGKWNIRGAWAAATDYRIGDLVTESDDSWVCAVDHTSASSFATDEAAGRWVRLSGVSHRALASVSPGEGASLVGIEDTGGLFTATDVEAALAEILSRLGAVTTGDGASMVGIEDAGDLFAAGNVEAALAEILNRLAAATTGDGASMVGIEDAMGYYTGADVEEILAEIGAQLVPASTTAQGFVELATVNEAAAGTDAARAVTPEALAGAASMQVLLASMAYNRETKIVDSSGLASDQLGKAVAISADAATFIATKNQWVFCYVKSAGQWVLQGQFRATDASIGYISSVALSADGNTAVIGYYAANDGTNFGVAYVFTRSGSSWTQQGKLSASDGAATHFGLSVAISADGNTVACGAYQSDVGGQTDAGAVYVYARSGSQWSEQQKIQNATPEAFEYFGYAVSLSASGDVLGIGAYGADVSTNQNQGRVYVFRRSGGTWAQDVSLTASDGAANNNLGKSVSVSASGDAVVAGAPQATISGEALRGAAYIYRKSGTAWTEFDKLFSNPGDLYFGTELKISADGKTILATSPNATVNSIASAGKVYVFEYEQAAWRETNQVYAQDTATDDSGFGDSLALSPNAHVAVCGAPNFDETNANQGAVYVFEKVVS